VGVAGGDAPAPAVVEGEDTGAGVLPPSFKAEAAEKAAAEKAAAATAALVAAENKSKADQDGRLLVQHVPEGPPATTATLRPELERGCDEVRKC
jgi:hypothetical protein